MRESEREHKQEVGAEREADSLLSREPDEGFTLRTPGSWPEQKEDAKLTEPPGALWYFFFFFLK